MSTHSQIGIYDNGKVRSIYCQFDGYISNNGAILQKYYTDPEEVNKLIALGDLSVLGKRTGEKVDFERMYRDAVYREKYDGQCVAYHRDRGEDLNITVFDSVDDMLDIEEYNYLFRDGEWFVSCEETDDVFRPLKDYV